MAACDPKQEELWQREAAADADRNSLEEALSKMADIEKEIMSSNQVPIKFRSLRAYVVTLIG